MLSVLYLMGQFHLPAPKVHLCWLNDTLIEIGKVLPSKRQIKKHTLVEYVEYVESVEFRCTNGKDPVESCRATP